MVDGSRDQVTDAEARELEWVEACVRQLAGEGSSADRDAFAARLTTTSESDRATYEEVRRLFAIVTEYADDPTASGERQDGWPVIAARIRAERDADQRLLSAVRRWSDEAGGDTDAASGTEAEAVGELFAAVDRMARPTPSRDLFPGVLRAIESERTAPTVAPRGRLLQLIGVAVFGGAVAATFLIGLALGWFAPSTPVEPNRDGYVAGDKDGRMADPNNRVDEPDTPDPDRPGPDRNGPIVNANTETGTVTVEPGPAFRAENLVGIGVGSFGPPAPGGAPIGRIDGEAVDFAEFVAARSDTGPMAPPQPPLPVLRTIRFKRELHRDLPFEFIEPIRHRILGPGEMQAKLPLPTIDGDVLLHRGTMPGTLQVRTARGSGTTIHEHAGIERFLLTPMDAAADVDDGDGENAEITYAIRFTHDAVSDEWFASPAVVLVSTQPINGRRLVLLDGDLDGRFHTFGVDRIADSQDLTAMRLTPVQRIGESLYRLQPRDGGSEVRVLPYSGETGTVTIETRYADGIRVERLVLRRAVSEPGSDHAAEVRLDHYDCKRPIQLPVGRWELIDGLLRTPDGRRVAIRPVDATLRDRYQTWTERPLPQAAPEFRIEPITRALRSEQPLAPGARFVLGSLPRLVPLRGTEPSLKPGLLRLRVLLLGDAGETYAPLDAQQVGPVVPDRALLVGDIRPDATAPVLGFGNLRRSYEPDRPVTVTFSDDVIQRPGPRYLRLEERTLSKAIFGSPSVCAVRHD